jgi:hypothetical protein
MLPEDEGIRSILEPIIGPWYASLKDPQKAQEQILSDLLKRYGANQYGATRHALEISGIEDYRNNFPVVDYKGLQPYLAQVQAGNYQSILNEPPVEWVMTRGSTGRSSKVLPATQTHLKQVFTCGARALIHFALRKKNFDVFTGHILNLNFPSSVHTMTTDGREMTYGYSSGTYARLNPMFDRVSLIPRQEDIDLLGPGVGRSDWEKRFELAYLQAKDKTITATMGVTPVILAFARYVKRRHGKKPGELWKPQALFCTSVRKIQFKYAPILKRLYGDVPVVEMYTATEGVFAQQYDDLPYVTPNYDSYFFEVLTGKGPKMLHELKRGEWGQLLVSGCMFPRYDIGDMIEAAGNNHFRIFGRRNTMTLLEHRLYRLVTRWLA